MKNMDICQSIRPFKSENEKWGYKDINYNVIIAPIYNFAMPFHDGICWVKHLNWGGLNLKGEVVVPFIYQSVLRLAPDVYRVLGINDKYGVIDNKGNIILDVIYDTIIKECKNILKLRLGESITYASYEGEILFENLHDVSVFCLNSLIVLRENSFINVYLDNNNRIMLPKSYRIVDANEKYVVAQNLKERCKLYTYDNKGNLILERDVEAYSFYNKPLCNDTLILKTKHGLFLHYLQDQKEIKLDGFNDFTKLGKDYLVVMTPEKQWGVIDINGNIIMPCNYAGLGTNFGNDNIYGSYFDGKCLAASKDEETCGIIDLNQNVIIPFE